MKEIKRYLDEEGDASVPPDEFLNWREVIIKGEYLIAKDAVIMHSSEESIDDWAHVKVLPGKKHPSRPLCKVDHPLSLKRRYLLLIK